MSEETGTARDNLYDDMAIQLLNAGIQESVQDFVGQVRAAAGFRASPRQVAVALEALTASQKEISAASVAQIVEASRGDRSQRQRRNATSWQSLGAALTAKSQDGSPEGQREFIAVARQVAGPHASDALLLQVSLVLAQQGGRINENEVGLVARRLAKSAQDLSEEQLADHIRREHRSLREQRTARRKTRSSSAARRGPSYEPLERSGKRRWKPGGRRRVTIKFRDDES